MFDSDKPPAELLSHLVTSRGQAFTFLYYHSITHHAEPVLRYHSRLPPRVSLQALPPPPTVHPCHTVGLLGDMHCSACWMVSNVALQVLYGKHLPGSNRPNTRREQRPRHTEPTPRSSGYPLLMHIERDRCEIIKTSLCPRN